MSRATRCMKCGEREARVVRHTDIRKCSACGFVFTPCATTCPGYHLNLEGPARGRPIIEICDECVSYAKPDAKLDDRDACTWPEAYRHAAELLEPPTRKHTARRVKLTPYVRRKAG